VLAVAVTVMFPPVLLGKRYTASPLGFVAMLVGVPADVVTELRLYPLTPIIRVFPAPTPDNVQDAVIEPQLSTLVHC